MNTSMNKSAINGPGMRGSAMKTTRKKRQAGQAAVEFAFVMVFLIVFLLSFIEITALVYTYSVLADSAKEGVRYGVVHGTLSSTCNGPGVAGVPCDGGAAGVKAAVNSYASGSLNNTAGMTVTPTYPDGTSTPSSRVRVVVSYSYQPLFGLGWPTVTVNAASEGRITF
jgi:Flp pilus assembly protein TadG